ncbi:metallophosphoesterase [Nocardioides sp. SYSU D00038]|uniref:metallophosphoesterase family protein n=1 Tax=Nocardioides sp. SYSU D00038 TaxID=2812554 RepID=UPI0019671AA8|nr:metallophosphoesterase [Nocardioides sp. SYSU D00038]
MRTSVLTATAALLLLAGAGPPAASRPPAADAPEKDGERPVHVFVSAPDFLNADIGDTRLVRGPLRRQRRPGPAQSWSPAHRVSLERAVDEMLSFGPDSVLVAGDLVRGHWDQDLGGVRVFGPVRTVVERHRAIRAAGRFYYGEWVKRWTRNGFPRSRVHAAVGDHDIGDDPWPRGSGAVGAVPVFKETWARALTANGRRYREHPRGTGADRTAYATWLAPGLLLVTVDVFSRHRGRVEVTVRGGQLAWLDRVLAAAPDDATIVVQGHTPVLGPVRRLGSSALSVAGGEHSALWRTLQRHDVDLYLAGEVHALTATQRAPGDVVQLAHGGLFAWGDVDFVVGRVHADGRIELDARRLHDHASGRDALPGLWQTRGPVQRRVRLAERSVSVGAMTLLPDGTLTDRTGLLLPLDPARR